MVSRIRPSVLHRTHFCAKPYTLTRLTSTGGVGADQMFKGISPNKHAVSKTYMLKNVEICNNRWKDDCCSIRWATRDGNCISSERNRPNQGVCLPFGGETTVKRVTASLFLPRGTHHAFSHVLPAFNPLRVTPPRCIQNLSGRRELSCKLLSLRRFSVLSVGFSEAPAAKLEPPESVETSRRGRGESREIEGYF